MTQEDFKKLLEDNNARLREDARNDFRQFKIEVGEEFERQTGVLYEQLSDQVKTIAEQHLTTMQELRRISAEIEGLKEQMIEANIRLHHIESQLRRKVDYEEYEQLEKRVALLEAKTS